MGEQEPTRIRLAHGGGGSLMQQLIDSEFRRLYPDPQLLLHDAACLEFPSGRLAFSTDGYVVQPLEFPGGSIGSLAITGTANDLAMAGARPRHLSVALILEEGLPLPLLRRLVASMLQACHACGVTIAAGDTKVVERGKADGMFITTSGIGEVVAPAPIHPSRIRPGDRLLVSGDLGRHGVAILAARHGLRLEPPVRSDCAPLWPQVARLLEQGVEIHCLRDLTRGGLASALQELAVAAEVSFRVEEERLPVIEPVARCCDLLGFEPVHLANEGRFLAVVPAGAAELAAALLEPEGGGWIGTAVAPAAEGRVLLRTPYGSTRVLLPQSGEL
ncbi:MAG: hydrogenase expression/formation protein HypE, partial [Synechococcus sp.]